MQQIVACQIMLMAKYQLVLYEANNEIKTNLKYMQKQ